MFVLTLSRVQLFATPWTVARQAPLSRRFSRQEYWSRLPFPPPGDLPHPGIELASPALAGRFLTIEPPGKPLICMYSYMNGIPCREYSWKDYCDSLRGRGIQVAGDPADRETSHRVDIWLWILKLLHVLFSVQAIRLANIRMYTHTYTHARIYFLYMCLCINHIFNREICLLGSMNSWEFESSSSLERGVPGGTVVDSACQCRRCRRLRFDPWVGKIPWRTWQCTPVLWPGKFCGQRRLAGYSPRGRKELDTVEHTHTLEKSYARIYKNLKVYRLLEIFVEFTKP